MNRRGFIRGLAGILAAATGPSVLALEAFDRFKWKAPEGKWVAVLNPEWVNAPFEICFAWDLSKPWLNPPELPLPARFKTVEDMDACREVPPYILKRL